MRGRASASGAPRIGGGRPPPRAGGGSPFAQPRPPSLSASSSAWATRNESASSIRSAPSNFLQAMSTSAGKRDVSQRGIGNPNGEARGAGPNPRQGAVDARQHRPVVGIRLEEAERLVEAEEEIRLRDRALCKFVEEAQFPLSLVQRKAGGGGGQGLDEGAGGAHFLTSVSPHSVFERRLCHDPRHLKWRGGPPRGLPLARAVRGEIRGGGPPPGV